MLAVLIALVMMVVLVYAVAIYYMRRKEKMIVNSQTEIVRRTMCLDNANERLKSVEKLLEDTQGKLEEKRRQSQYLQPIITQYFIDNKSEIWLLFLIAHSKR